jgi:hypothetical protein
MNLQATLPSIDEATAIPAADDALARALSAAKLSGEAELVDALRARQHKLQLSDAVLE